MSKHDLKAIKLQVKVLENRIQGFIEAAVAIRMASSDIDLSHPLALITREILEAYTNDGVAAIAPWDGTVTDADYYRTHPIGGIEYLFRSKIDGNLSEPTLSSGVGPAWTDLAHNGFPVFWDEVTPYSIGEWVAVNYSGIYYTYTSKTAGNTNNLPLPETTDANWEYKGITKGYFPDDAPYSLNDIVLDGSDNLFISNVDNNTYTLDEDAPLNSDWVVIGYTPTGSTTKGIFPTTDTGQSVINIPHGLPSIPTWFSVQGSSIISIGVINKSDLTVDATNIIITPEFMNNDGEALNFLWKAEL